LIGFFYFYTEFYDPSSHVISTAHRDATFLPHSTYLSELHTRYRSIPFILDGFLRDVAERKWSFLLVDPFDRTYNPAKLVVAGSPLEDQIFGALCDTLDALVEEAYLILDPEELSHSEAVASEKKGGKKRNRNNKKKNKKNKAK
jgi:hypothetical protein